LLEKLIVISLLSAPTNGIVHRDHIMRSQLNLLIVAPYGSGKTTMSIQIEKEGLGYRLVNFTKASVLGTINRSGEFVPPVILKGAGRAILIDEFQNINPEVRDVLLSLMEEQRAEKELAFTVTSPINVTGDFYKIVVEDGSIKINVRACYIITTMKINLRRVQDLALLSRCYPIIAGFTYEDAEDVIMGRRKLDLSRVRRFRDLFVNVRTEISEVVSKAIFDDVVRVFKSFNIEAGHVLRAYGDIVRIANVISILEGEDNVKYYDELDIYIRLYALGIKGCELTFREHAILKILNEYGDLHISDIKHYLPYNDSQIAQSLRLLAEKNLIVIERGIIRLRRD